MAFLTFDQLPQMDEQGLKVVVMDNCSIHKSNALREPIEDEGIHLVSYPMRDLDSQDVL
jgi:transposase